MIARLALVIGLLVAPSALAQQPPVAPARVTASPAEIAAARAHGDTLIAAADAGEFFTNVTDSSMARVLHKPSGMSCLFSGGRQDRILVFSRGMEPPVPRGYDVACVTYIDELKLDFTQYATRYRPEISAEQDLQWSVDAILMRWPEATRHEGIVPTSSVEGRPVPLVAAFDVMLDGQPHITSVYVTHRNGWSHKIRVTGPGGEKATTALVFAATAIQFSFGSPPNSD